MLFRSARRAAACAHLRELADCAAGGAVAKVREQFQALAADGAAVAALPAGLMAHVEADLRQYDFTLIEERVREALAAIEARDTGADRAADASRPKEGMAS